MNGLHHKKSLCVAAWEEIKEGSYWQVSIVPRHLPTPESLFFSSFNIPPNCSSIEFTFLQSPTKQLPLPATIPTPLPPQSR